MTNNLWKLQSNDRLSSKFNNSSTPATPIDFFTLDMFTPSDREELEGFSLSPVRCKEKKEEVLIVDIQRQKSKNVPNSRPEEGQRKVREREESRRSRGLASKTKLKLHQQIRIAQQQLQEGETELAKVTSEYNIINDLARQRRKQKEDIANNEKMLSFKQDQLNDLNLLQAQILSTTKTDIQKQRELRVQNIQMLQKKRREVEELREKVTKKNQMTHYNEQLRAQKKRLESRLQELKKIEDDKLAMRSEAVREIVEKLISSNKAQIEKQCKDTIKLIRQTANQSPNPSLLRSLLENIGLGPDHYYTFSQLKKVPEFNFKKNKEAQKIMQILDKEIVVNIPDHSDNTHEPRQLVEMRNEIAKLENIKRLSDAEIQQKEEEIEELQKTRKRMIESVTELKKKKQHK